MDSESRNGLLAAQIGDQRMQFMLRRQLSIATGAENENALILDMMGQVGQKLNAAIVRPVEIIEDQQQGMHLTQRAQQAQRTLPQVKSFLLVRHCLYGSAWRMRGMKGQFWEERAQPLKLQWRDQGNVRLSRRRNDIHQFFEGRRPLQQGAQLLRPEVIRNGPLLLIRPAPGHGPAARICLKAELFGQARLADARLALEQQEM